MWCEFSKHCSEPVSLACYVVYSAGLYIQVQGRLHWSQITTTHCIINQESAVLIYFVAVARIHAKDQLYMEHNQSEIVPEYNGNL